MAEEKKTTEPVNEGDKNPSKGKTDAQVRQEALRKYSPGNDKDWKGASGYSGRFREVKNDNYEKPDNDYTYKGGFYYDSQLENPYLSVSLHANTKLKDGVWEAWSDEGKDLLEAIGGDDSPEWSKKYGKEPIARCIMSEDFSYSIANNFSDYNAGNPIESVFETFKPYAPIFGKFGTALKEAADSTNIKGSGIVDLMKSVGSKAGQIMNTASGYLNKALFVQGSRFSYYNGTQFNFNNMEMKFIAFSDYVTSDGGSWVFQSVEDYIKRLQPYVMGVYSPYNADFLANSGLQGAAKEFIQEYVGFQDPPGGFEMDTKALNNALKGTLRLNIGATWAIENLVIRGMNVNMSRVQAKHPENPGETIPLYAEISLQLAPASAIVDTGYRNILDHGGMTSHRTAIRDGYIAKLQKLKENNVYKT